MQQLNNVINKKKDEAVPVPRKVSSIKYGVSTSTIKLAEHTSVQLLLVGLSWTLPPWNAGNATTHHTTIYRTTTEHS